MEKVAQKGSDAGQQVVEEPLQSGDVAFRQVGGRAQVLDEGQQAGAERRRSQVVVWSGLVWSLLEWEEEEEWGRTYSRTACASTARLTRRAVRVAAAGGVDGDTEGRDGRGRGHAAGHWVVFCQLGSAGGCRTMEPDVVDGEWEGRHGKGR